MNAKWLVLVVCGLLVGPNALAQQAEVSGSFAGVVEPSADPTLSGEKVTGTFQIGPGTLGASIFSSPTQVEYFQDYFTATIFFPVQGAVTPFSITSGYVAVAENGSNQQISFGTVFGGYYFGVGMNLEANPGALFTGLDATSFHAGVVNLPASNVAFSFADVASCQCNLTGTIDLSRVTFQAAVAPVPEPGSTAMLFAGLLLMLSLTWLRRRERASQGASISASFKTSPGFSSVGSRRAVRLGLVSGSSRGRLAVSYRAAGDASSAHRSGSGTTHSG